MNAALRRIGSIMSPIALLVALLALVVTAAGAGYAAGKIDTKDIKDNAVTTAKIKNGTIAVKDLKKEEKQKAVAFRNGGEGDCIWRSGAALISGLGGPTFRKDRFGTVHLSGVAVAADGPGGDAVCDSSDPGQLADAIAFVLPAGYIPAKSLIVGGSTGGVVIAGKGGLVGPGIALPAGAVAGLSGGSGNLALLDGVSFQPAGSKVVLSRTPASGRVSPGLLKELGLR